MNGMDGWVGRVRLSGFTVARVTPRKGTCMQATSSQVTKISCGRVLGLLHNPCNPAANWTTAQAHPPMEVGRSWEGRGGKRREEEGRERGERGEMVGARK